MQYKLVIIQQDLIDSLLSWLLLSLLYLRYLEEFLFPVLQQRCRLVEITLFKKKGNTKSLKAHDIVNESFDKALSDLCFCVHQEIKSEIFSTELLCTKG